MSAPATDLRNAAARPGVLRVACIGLGYFGQFHLSAWQRIEGVSLVGVADRDFDKAATAAREFGAAGYADMETMLDAVDPDIVDIVTPPSAHAEMVRAALKPGRIIICQKPFCENLQQAGEVARQAEEADATLIVHENFRFQPWHREVKRQIESGAIGAVYQCRFHLRPGDGRGPDAYLARQPSFQTMGRFLIRETGVHFIDLFRWLLGEVVSVYADLRRVNPVIRGEDAGLLLLRHESGAVSLFDGNRLADHAAANRRKTMGEMVVEGEAGTLRLDGEGRLYLRRFGSNVETAIPFDYADVDFGGGCVEALNRHVVNHIRFGDVLENRACDYLRIVALDEAAYRSAATGCMVNVDDRQS